LYHGEGEETRGSPWKQQQVEDMGHVRGGGGWTVRRRIESEVEKKR
jgi:hypothetical protein